MLHEYKNEIHELKLSNAHFAKIFEKHNSLDQKIEDVEVQCVGAPRYRITVKSTDYILAEKTLKKAADNCIKVIEDSNGKGEFLRELD